MKTSKTFRLSEEAVNILNEQANATEFLEDLILDKYQRPLEVVPLKQVKDLLEAVKPPVVITKESSPTARTDATLLDDLDEFIKAYSDPNDKKPPNINFGYPCCTVGKCKHWEWDGDVWRNQLTGKPKEESF